MGWGSQGQSGTERPAQLRELENWTWIALIDHPHACTRAINKRSTIKTQVLAVLEDPKVKLAIARNTRASGSDLPTPQFHFARNPNTTARSGIRYFSPQLPPSSWACCFSWAFSLAGLAPPCFVRRLAQPTKPQANITQTS